MKSFYFGLMVLTAIAFFPTLAHAGSEHNMIGWAWSDTIGWISFNCTNDNSCSRYVAGPGPHGLSPYSLDGDQNWRISILEYNDAIVLYNQGQMSESEFAMVTAMYQYRSGGVRTGEYHGTLNGTSYGVNLNANDTLTGYAWSPHIGWIQFGGLGPSFPSGNGTQPIEAKVNGTNLQGWAKAIAADGNGWDGWISLSGAGPSYGVTKSGSAFSGYAWGGDVVGWVSFDAAGANGVRLASDVTLDIRTGGVNGTSIIGQTIPYDSVPTFVWTVVNAPSASCSVFKTSSGGSSLNPPTNAIYFGSSGSLTDAPLQHSPSSLEWLYEYRLTCSNPAIERYTGFVVDNITSSFTLGPADTARIQFLVSGDSDSELKTIPVNAFGGYSNPVTISISTYPTPPAGTTFLYSLGGGAFSATPPSVVVNPGNSTTFQVRVSKSINTQYTVTLRGQGASAPDQYKNIIINPTTYDPTIGEF